MAPETLPPAWNPLVPLGLGLFGVMTVSLARYPAEIGVVLLLFAGVGLALRLSLRGGLRDGTLMLPWATVFFAIHIGFTVWGGEGLTIRRAIEREIIVLLRLVGLSLVIGTVRRGLEAQRIIDSLKTGLDRLRIRSHLGEDFLQTMSLMLAFIPQVQKEYRELARFQQALGFRQPAGLRERTHYYGGHLATVLSRSMERARQVGQVMQLRHYGEVVPRGQLTPEPFRRRDGLALLGGMMVLGTALWVM